MTANVATTESSAPRAARMAVRPGTWLAALAVVLAAAAFIFSGLRSEPHFADETAMIAQSYYWTLFKTGRWNHPDWLHYAAFDHPPLPKYAFGLFLDLAGKPVPENIDWWMNWSGYERIDGRWVQSLRGGDFRPPSDPGVLFWARVPSGIFGVVGALAAFLIGLQIRGRTFGVVAAALVIVNPLYLTHARRAMSDSFTECLVLAAVAAGLWGARLVWSNEFRWRDWLLFSVAASVSCGLAALAKLNGGIATAIVLAILSLHWLLAVWIRAQRTRTPDAPSGLNASIAPLATAAVGIASFAVFVLLNPFMTTRPRLGPDADPKSRELATQGLLDRAKYLVQFRREWSRDALAAPAFQKDWLHTTPERVQMTVWEGFGRYSVLGPRNIRTMEPRPERERFSEYGRRSSLVWFPLFVWGVACAVRGGWRSFRSGAAPLEWGLILYAAAVLAIVVFMIPLNWDRYYLPLQSCAALVVPYGLASALDYVRSRLVLKPATNVATNN